MPEVPDLDELFKLELEGEEVVRRLLGISDDDPDPSPEIDENDDT